MKKLILAAVIAVGVGVAAPVVTAAAPAWAINCSFGDQFYHFISDSTADAQLIDSTGYLYDNAGGGWSSGDLFCQVQQPGFGSGWYQWVKKGTSSCLTVNASASYKLDLVTCNPTYTSQEWAFLDPIGTEDYSRWSSDYTASGYRDVQSQGPDSYDLGLQGWTPWNANNIIWSWTLDGPYR